MGLLGLEDTLSSTAASVGVVHAREPLNKAAHTAPCTHRARCQDRNINRAQDLQVLYARVRRSPYSMLSLDDATAASVTMDAATGGLIALAGPSSCQRHAPP